MNGRDTKPLTPYQRLHLAAKGLVCDLLYSREEAVVLVTEDEYTDLDVYMLEQRVTAAIRLGCVAEVRLSKDGTAYVVARRLIEVPREISADLKELL